MARRGRRGAGVEIISMKRARKWHRGFPISCAGKQGEVVGFRIKVGNRHSAYGRARPPSRLVYFKSRMTDCSLSMHHASISVCGFRLAQARRSMWRSAQLWRPAS
jgi:hypothetical protein